MYNLLRLKTAAHEITKSIQSAISEDMLVKQFEAAYDRMHEDYKNQNISICIKANIEITKTEMIKSEIWSEFSQKKVEKTAKQKQLIDLSQSVMPFMGVQGVESMEIKAGDGSVGVKITKDGIKPLDGKEEKSADSENGGEVK